MKKFLRGDFTLDVLIDGMYKELGDVLWYVAMLAEELDVPLDDLAEGVLSKLAAIKATYDCLREQRGAQPCDLNATELTHKYTMPEDYILWAKEFMEVRE